jgi:acyl-coenzyme A synthetase/AMP-(fatty) acid ligase
MSDLRGLLAQAAPGAARLFGPSSGLALADLAANTGLGAARAGLTGRAVLVRTHGQLGAAQALVELDGLARRIVLSPPDLAEEHLAGVIGTAGIDAIVTDVADPVLSALGPPVHVLAPPAKTVPESDTPPSPTEWLLFTSGTTGAPKMVIHTLAGLTGAIRPRAAGAAPIVWGTFYDIRRYGGLQILLRALTGGSSMILSDSHEAPADHLVRLGALGVTHLSGTPSHWRRALMTPQVAAIAPAYVRLSGEIADQAVLDSLKTAFPASAIGHAYASTEAGVGFEVDDGLEGFPADFVGRPDAPVEMKVEDGSLRIRSARAANGYAGAEAPALADADGFVDTGDMVELRAGRWYFAGRRNGVINVGGLKVHPEEVEAVLNDHPAVRMSLVRARKNPITGAVVTADVALVDPDAAVTPEAQKALRDAILTACRAVLPPHKAPASVRFVPTLNVTAGGKLDRTHA